VLVTVVSTGIGMTTGLGLAEHVVGAHLDGGRDRALDPAAPTSTVTSPLTSPLTESLTA
jgi:hypothetical protein